MGLILVIALSSGGFILIIVGLYVTCCVMKASKGVKPISEEELKELEEEMADDATMVSESGLTHGSSRPTTAMEAESEVIMHPVLGAMGGFSLHNISNAEEALRHAHKRGTPGPLELAQRRTDEFGDTWIL